MIKNVKVYTDKYDPCEWQWSSRVTGTKLVSEMTKEELQQALCRSIDALETFGEFMETGAEKISEFMKDG